MKIKFGAFVVDGRGKIGGTVFSRNKGGAFARNKVTPVNPNTLAQQAIRNVFGFVSGAWRGLTQAQRNAWNEAVNQWTTTDVFADVLVPSGKALFQRLNTVLYNIGFDVLVEPPTPLSPSGQVLASCTAEETGQVISPVFSFAAAPTDSYAFSTTPQQSGATTNVSNQFRRILVTNGASLPTPAALGAAYTARYGALEAGKVFAIKVDVIAEATGQVTPIGQLFVTVGA